MSVAKHIKQLAGESVIYGALGAATRLIGLVLLPVYSRSFTPSEFGVVTLLLTVEGLLSMLTVLGLDNAITRWFYDSEETHERQRTISSGFWASMASSAIVGGVMALLSPQISTLFSGTADNVPAVCLLAAALPFSLIRFFCGLSLRLQRRAIAAASYLGLSLLCNIGFIVLFVLGWQQGLYGLFLAKLAAAVLSATLGLPFLRCWIIPRACSWQRLQKMLRFSLPLVPAALGMWLMAFADRFCLNSFCSRDEVGLYGVAALVASGTTLITTAFSLAWGPFSLSILQQEDAQRVYAKVFELYCLLGCLFCSAIAFFSPLLLTILSTKAYYPAITCIPILAFSALMYGARAIAVLGCSIAKKSVPAAMSVAVGVTVNIGLNLALVPVFGREGAALATLIGYTSCVFLLFTASQKHHPTPYRWRIGVFCFAYAWLLIGIEQWFVHDTPVGFVIRLGMLLSFAPFGALLGVVKWSHIRYLARLSST